MTPAAAMTAYLRTQPGLSRSYLYRRIMDRTLPSYKQVRRVLLRRRDVDAWMEQGRREAI